MDQENETLDKVKAVLVALTWQKWLMIVGLIVVSQLTPVMAERINPGYAKTEATGHITGSLMFGGTIAYVMKKILG